MFAFFPKAAVQNRRFRLGPNVRFRPKADIPIFRETVHKTRLWVFSASESAGRKSLFDCLTLVSWDVIELGLLPETKTRREPIWVLVPPSHAQPLALSIKKKKAQLVANSP